MPLSRSIKAVHVKYWRLFSPQECFYLKGQFETESSFGFEILLKKDLKIGDGQTVKIFNLSDEQTFNRTAEVFLIGKATGT